MRRTTWLLCVLLSGPLTGGCNKDACERYADDVNAKYTSCGIMAQPGSGSTSSGACTDALAKQANCLDACLPKVDCGCTKDPTAAGCAAKLKPYQDCVTACAS
jgi:hypothetical protein